MPLHASDFKTPPSKMQPAESPPSSIKLDEKKTPKQRNLVPSSSSVEFKRTTYYNCCGTQCDRRLMQFLAQLVLTMFMLAFCFYQIAFDDPSRTGPIWGLIGTFTGFWFEAPKINPKK